MIPLRLLLVNKATTKEITGSGFIGRIEITYPDLVKLLGKPHFEGSPDNKTDAEWAYMLDRNSKTVVTVYNYVTLGSFKKETKWHIGGKGDHSLIKDWVFTVFKKPLIH